MRNRIELTVPRSLGRQRDKRAKPGKSRAWGTSGTLLKDFAVGASLPLFVLLAWQLAGNFGYLNPLFLPTPLSIAETFRDLLINGHLVVHLGDSIRRALFGFLLGGGLGFAFGIAVGLFRIAEYTLDPTMQMLRMIPHLAIAPLIILWFGFGEWSNVLIVAKGAFFSLYIHTFMGIRNVDNKLFDVARVLAFSKRKRLFRLVVPAALPQILLGMRMSLALSWIGLVVAELIGGNTGIGFLMNVGKQNSDTALIFVGVIVFAVVGKAVDSFVRYLERKWLHWQERFEG